LTTMKHLIAVLLLPALLTDRSLAAGVLLAERTPLARPTAAVEVFQGGALAPLSLFSRLHRFFIRPFQKTHLTPAILLRQQYPEAWYARIMKRAVEQESARPVFSKIVKFVIAVFISPIEIRFLATPEGRARFITAHDEVFVEGEAKKISLAETPEGGRTFLGALAGWSRLFERAAEAQSPFYRTALRMTAYVYAYAMKTWYGFQVWSRWLPVGTPYAVSTVAWWRQTPEERVSSPARNVTMSEEERNALLVELKPLIVQAINSFSRTFPRDLSDDLFQGVCLALLRALPKNDMNRFSTEQDQRAYIAKVVENKLWEYMRNNWRQEGRPTRETYKILVEFRKIKADMISRDRRVPTEDAVLDELTRIHMRGYHPSPGLIKADDFETWRQRIAIHFRQSQLDMDTAPRPLGDILGRDADGQRVEDWDQAADERSLRQEEGFPEGSRYAQMWSQVQEAMNRLRPEDANLLREEYLLESDGPDIPKRKLAGILRRVKAKLAIMGVLRSNIPFKDGRPASYASLAQEWLNQYRPSGIPPPYDSWATPFGLSGDQMAGFVRAMSRGQAVAAQILAQADEESHEEAAAPIDMNSLREILSKELTPDALTLFSPREIAKALWTLRQENGAAPSTKLLAQTLGIPRNTLERRISRGMRDPILSWLKSFVLSWNALHLGNEIDLSALDREFLDPTFGRIINPLAEAWLRLFINNGGVIPTSPEWSAESGFERSDLLHRVQRYKNRIADRILELAGGPDWPEAKPWLSVLEVILNRESTPCFGVTLELLKKAKEDAWTSSPGLSRGMRRRIDARILAYYWLFYYVRFGTAPSPSEWSFMSGLYAYRWLQRGDKRNKEMQVAREIITLSETGGDPVTVRAEGLGLLMQCVVRMFHCPEGSLASKGESERLAYLPPLDAKETSAIIRSDQKQIWGFDERALRWVLLRSNRNRVDLNQQKAWFKQGYRQIVITGLALSPRGSWLNIMDPGFPMADFGKAYRSGRAVAFLHWSADRQRFRPVLASVSTKSNPTVAIPMEFKIVLGRKHADAPFRLLDTYYGSYRQSGLMELTDAGFREIKIIGMERKGKKIFGLSGEIVLPDDVLAMPEGPSDVVFRQAWPNDGRFSGAMVPIQANLYKTGDLKQPRTIIFRVVSGRHRGAPDFEVLHPYRGKEDWSKRITEWRAAGLDRIRINSVRVSHFGRAQLFASHKELTVLPDAVSDLADLEFVLPRDGDPLVPLVTRPVSRTGKPLPPVWFWLISAGSPEHEPSLETVKSSKCPGRFMWNWLRTKSGLQENDRVWIPWTRQSAHGLTDPFSRQAYEIRDLPETGPHYGVYRWTNGELLLEGFWLRNRFVGIDPMTRGYRNTLFRRVWRTKDRRIRSSA
jgi:hypothetical protein